MKALSVFRPRVASRVPTCPDMVIDQAVLDTCIDFCERSLVVKQNLSAFPTVADTSTYSLTGPSQESVARVMRLWCNGLELSPSTEDTAPSPFSFVPSIPGETRTKATPLVFNETTPGVISFFPCPDAVYTINVRAALRPTRDATQVEDVLYESHIDGVVAGALARLFLLPDHFNPVLAKVNSDLFEVKLNAASIQASRGSTRAQSRIRPVHI